MAATLSERFHAWLARVWNGETSLITDDGWLPNPTDQPTATNFVTKYG